MEQNRSTEVFDYSYVNATARVALYDDMRSAPRITKITPDTTAEYIEHLTTTVYDQSRSAGGKIPYTVIREVSENFIHAQFKEIVVSILDDGNTIRFADQGPGIQEKERAQKPGFSSAIEPMKNYIRGVGSGFPIVKDYLDGMEGSIVIEDNLTNGAVVTISLVEKPSAAPQQKFAPVVVAQPLPRIALSEKEERLVKLFLHEGDLRVTDIKNLTDMPQSTIHHTLTALEEAGLVEMTIGKKRNLTEIGRQVAITL